MKKILLILLGVLTALPTFAQDFEYTYEGQTLTYTIIDEAAKTCRTKGGGLYSHGNTASGTLAIPSYAYYENIPYKVVEIGSFGFYAQKSLLEVIIPEGVTSIKIQAFWNCNQLRDIIIPESVTSIGSGVFSNCSSLTQIEIPRSLAVIESGTFNNCSNLAEVKISDGVRTISRESFQDCRSLTQISFPKSVAIIEDYAFQLCSNISNVYFHNPEVSVGGHAFSNCSKISDIYLNFPNPQQFDDRINSVSQTANLHVIPTAYSSFLVSEWDFKDRLVIEPSFTAYGIKYEWIDDEYKALKITGFDNNVELVEINEDLNGLPIVGFDCVMKDYPSISHIIYNRTEVPADFCKDMTSLKLIEFGENVTTIGDNAFAGASSLERIDFGSQVASIGENAFAGTANLVTVTLSASVPPVLGANAFDVLNRKPELYLSSEQYAAYSDDTLDWNKYFDIYKTENTVNDAGWGYDIVNLYYDNTNIYIDSFDVRLTSIPENIEGNELSIPAVIEVNGHPAHVIEMNIAEVPTGTKFTTLRIEDSAKPLIQGCDLSSLVKSTSVYIGRNIQVASGYEESLYGYNRLTDVTFSNEVTKIPARMFKDAMRISAIDLSETKIDSIGNEAFNGAVRLENIKWPLTLKYIGDEAFGGVSLSEISLPASLEEIGSRAFYALGELTSVAINSPIKRIGSEAFASCAALTNIAFNQTVGTIEAGAFADLSLETLDAKAGTIKGEAFANVKITGSEPMAINASVVEENAFRNATLTGVKLVTDTVFANVFNNASIDQLKTVEITSKEIAGNPFGTGELTAIESFFLTTGNIAREAFYGLTLGETADIEINADIIATQAFQGMKAPQYKRFVINVKDYISTLAFSTLTAVSEVPLEINANIIYDGAFQYLNKDNISVTVAKINANTIKANAFGSAAGLKEVYVTGENLIEEGAFKSCNYLRYLNLNIPEINRINSTSMTGLATIDFGEKVKIIGTDAFVNTSNLTTVNFNGCQLTKIGGSAFKSTNISKVVFPTIEGAESTCDIYTEAFNTDKIKYIDLGNTVKSVANKCFNGDVEYVDLGCVESLGSKFIYYNRGIYNVNLIIPGSVTKFGDLGSYGYSAKIKHIIFEYSDVPLSVKFDSYANMSEAVLEFDREVNATWTGTARKVNTSDNPEHRFNVQICAADSICLGSAPATATFKATCAPSVLNISEGVEGLAVADGNTLTIPDVDLHIPASVKLLSGEFTMPVDFKLNLADGDPDNVLDLSLLKFAAEENSHPEIFIGRNIALDGYSLGRLNTWKTAVFGETVTAIADHCFDGCADLTTAVLSPSIKTIGKSAFIDCTGLVTLELSENLETIDASAYDGCNSIEKVVARGTVPAGGTFAFTKSFAQKTPLYVPEGYVEDYEDSKNFTWFDTILTHADGALIEGMEVDDSEEPVDEYFTAGSQCHLPTWLKILYHIYKKVTGQGAPARVAALAEAADNQPSNDDLLWISSDPRIASIDNEGYVTFHSNEPVTITAVATDGSGARLNIELNKDVLGDVDKNGVINVQDLNAMISGFLAPATQPVSLKVADMNSDGEINVLDINILISNILNIK